MRWDNELWLRRALPFDYATWLRLYLAGGGVITHHYRYPMNSMYVALCSAEIQPHYGANANNIIVPDGINVSGATGHIHLFIIERGVALFRGFHDVTAKPRGHFVPIYSDTELP